eukprot:2159470-Pleurochrysis_carterae.AAC.1
MRIPLMRLQRQHLIPLPRRTRHAWLPDINYMFWDIILRPSMPRRDHGPYLIRKPAPLSWRLRIGIDSLPVDQLRCTPTTPLQLASSVTSNVRFHRDSKGGESSWDPIYP